MIAHDIWSIAGAILISVGGAGTIIIAVVEFVVNRIAFRLDKKYAQRLDKELEQYKLNIEHCRYVTKAQFDREFEIYHKLSEAFWNMIVKLSSFTKRDYNSEVSVNQKIEISDDEVKQLIVTTSKAQNTLYYNAAFIPQDIFDLYESIMKKANTLFWHYHDRVSASAIMKESKDIISEEDKILEEIIESEINEVNSKLRDYLSTLTIVD